MEKKNERNALKENRKLLEEILDAIKESHCPYTCFIIAVLFFNIVVDISLFVSGTLQNTTLQDTIENVLMVSVFFLWGFVVILYAVVSEVMNRRGD